MRQDVHDAVLATMKLMEHAKEANQTGLHPEQGNRGALTSGTHFKPVERIIRADLIKAGLPDSEVFSGGHGMNLPGWYRPVKNWDILAIHNDHLVAAIELKTQNSSAGNNYNNRGEEAIGTAADAQQSVKNGLVPGNPAPAFAYAMITSEPSMMQRRKLQNARFPTDPIFTDTSYWDRYGILLERAIADRLYQTGWLAFVDITANTVIEPNPLFTYDKFIAYLQGMVRASLA